MKPKLFFTLSLATFLLIFSWLFPLTRPFWDWVDVSAFTYLNRWIETNHNAQVFWALSNHKGVDWLHDIIIISFFLIAIGRAGTEEKKRRNIGALLFSILCIALTIACVNRGIFKKVTPIERMSPSLVIEHAVCLEEKLPEIQTKYRSNQSFPGDHATLATLFVGLTFFLLGRRAGTLALLYGILMCLPRLVVGSHWLTDIVMGSVPITLFVLSWTFATPIAHTCIHFLGGNHKRTRKV